MFLVLDLHISQRRASSRLSYANNYVRILSGCTACCLCIVLRKLPIL